MPTMQLTLAGGAQSPEKVSVLLEILFLLTVLSVAPAIMLTVTSFTRIIIVFSFLRQAMGVQQLPPHPDSCQPCHFYDGGHHVPRGQADQ